MSEIHDIFKAHETFKLFKFFVWRKVAPKVISGPGCALALVV